MRNLSEINMNECWRPVRRAPPTNAQFAAFEAHFGVTLPGDYVAFLRHSNGGHPEINAFRVNGVLWAVDTFYHLDDDREGLGGLWEETRVWQSVLSPNIVAIGEDGGGNQILLSFEHDPPSVKICIHDEAMRLIDVADSFAEFIDMLYDDPDLI